MVSVLSTGRPFAGVVKLGRSDYSVLCPAILGRVKRILGERMAVVKPLRDMGGHTAQSLAEVLDEIGGTPRCVDLCSRYRNGCPIQADNRAVVEDRCFAARADIEDVLERQLREGRRPVDYGEAVSHR